MKKNLFLMLALASTGCALASETFDVVVSDGTEEVTVENVQVNPEEEAVVEVGTYKVCLSCMTTRAKRMMHCRVCMRDEVVAESDFETEEDSDQPVSLTVADQEGNEITVTVAPHAESAE